MLGTTLKRKDDNSVWTITGVFNDDWVLTREDAFTTNIHMSAADIRKAFVRATRTETPEVATDSPEGRRMLARAHRRLSLVQALDDGSVAPGDELPNAGPDDAGDIDPFAGMIRDDDGTELTKAHVSAARRLARRFRRANIRTPEQVFEQQTSIDANRDAQKIIANRKRLDEWEHGHFTAPPAVERELFAYIAERDRQAAGA